ncbi:MAG: hypothetical protein GXO85_07945 [Chlorobi bacterium]|nr:hypothetical protein [Chlorobiota bacterium]
MPNQKRILLSFVGTNDAGKLIENNSEGAIITALRNEKFDEVILLWNDNKTNSLTYTEIVVHLKKEIKKQKLVKKVSDTLLDIKDVTDHNEIYIKLKEVTNNLKKEDGISYTASITSGTPSMQACWILLGESGEFSEEYPLNLIQVKDPRFGTSANVPVRLDTALPKIVSLKNEVAKLKNDLIPTAEINVPNGQLIIDNALIPLSPIEFCYYRYFAERVIDGLGDERFSGFSVSLDFMEKIYSYHEESFEFLDTNRIDLGRMIRKKEELSIQTFRGNVSKANRKIRETLNNETLAETFMISIEGGRGAKFYGIKAPAEKLKIKN